MAGSARISFFTPFDLHKQLINHYVLTKRGSTSLLKRDTSKDKTDFDVIRENHKFLWDESEEPDTWEKRLAKKYYDRLFKEYCICDLSRYKENKVAMRWQTEAEMVSGKGQFVCGEKRCSNSEGLRTWEVNFGYIESGEKKNTLVKLRLCPDCSYKLNYRSKKREVKRNTRKRLSTEEESAQNSKKVKKASDELDKDTEQPNESAKTHEEISEEEHNVWKDRLAPVEERSRDEDFEEYLEQLLL